MGWAPEWDTACTCHRTGETSYEIGFYITYGTEHYSYLFALPREQDCRRMCDRLNELELTWLDIARLSKEERRKLKEELMSLLAW
jgi:hypothetical protein